jgi:hypothetical protein
MEIENIIVQKKRGPVPKVKLEKLPRVNKTDDPTYYTEYYTNHKDNYKQYSEKAKEKVYHCECCKITTAFRHHLRHERTSRHIKKAAQIIV